MPTCADYEGYDLGRNTGGQVIVELEHSYKDFSDPSCPGLSLRMGQPPSHQSPAQFRWRSLRLFRLALLLCFPLSASGTEDDSGILLQRPRPGPQDLPREGSDRGSQNPNQPSLAAYLDFTLADAARACGAETSGSKGLKGIENKAWDCIFLELDVDGDGSITPSDVEKASWLQGSALVQRLNISKQDCREASALLATWYPKLAPFLVRHAQEVLLSAWTGSAPAGLPEPDVGFAFEDREKAGLQLTELTDCEDALLKTILPAFNLVTSVVGLSLPNSASEALLQRVSMDVSLLSKVQTLISELGGPGEIVKNTEVTASFVFKVAAELWNEGVLATVLNEVRQSMSWWDWVSTSVPMVASLSSFFLTGSTLNLVIAVGLGGINVVNLGKALMSLEGACL